ncbi:hypothetical protein ACH42_09035 [Endozoicomonas sp. (ex Bugula neritina AB1)]|nr:hypothetical protein ACH42_09035 [Endozoicomonas sp. (ex Bugula neritina AB1)]
MNYWLIESPFGTLLLVSDGEALKQLSFINAANFNPEMNWCKTQDSILKTAQTQLEEWFVGKRRIFDLPLSPEGTEFQKVIWNQLRKIPYGETRSYGDLAQAINKPTASRAVGAANGKNPIALIIPCHRVIGADGTLTGYAYGVELKEKLLALESQQKISQNTLQSV